MRVANLLVRWGVALLLLAAASAPIASAADLPTSIALPNGWLPEGIVSGRGPVLYAGSRASGAIYAVDPRTGAGEVLVQGQVG